MSACTTFSLPGTANPITDSYDAVPTVDFGYARYRPTAINITGQYYNFSNIRYAAAPVGSLRWRAPQAPPRNHLSKSVNDGSLGHICPQAPPKWFIQGQTALGNQSAVITPGVSSRQKARIVYFLMLLCQLNCSNENTTRAKRRPFSLTSMVAVSSLARRGSGTPPTDCSRLVIAISCMCQPTIGYVFSVNVAL